MKGPREQDCSKTAALISLPTLESEREIEKGGEGGREIGEGDGYDMCVGLIDQNQPYVKQKKGRMISKRRGVDAIFKFCK